MSDSTLYTIGTALNRARDNGFAVEVLVDGTWLHGQVLAVDGYGVCLRSVDSDQHSVVRVESIAAVTVRAAPPRQVAIQATPYGGHTMPGPRSPYE
jgi:sRNA-binding regulator protein Hfq